MFKMISSPEFQTLTKDTFSRAASVAIFNYLEEIYVGKYMYDLVAINEFFREQSIAELRVEFDCCDDYYSDDEFLTKIVLPHSTYLKKLENGNYVRRI